jgi:hypothetical protein
MTNIGADDVAETAKGLRAVLDEIEVGNLVCHPATRHRIEGALFALEQLTGSAGPPESRLCPLLLELRPGAKSGVVARQRCGRDDGCGMGDADRRCYLLGGLVGVDRSGHGGLARSWLDEPLAPRITAG